MKALEIKKLTNRTMNFRKIMLGSTYKLFVLLVFISVFSKVGFNLESSTMETQEKTNTPRLLIKNYQENNASIQMVERIEPAVPLLQPESRNEHGLYPDLNNQSEHLVRNKIVGTISSSTIPNSANNNNTITII